ncbi:MAG: threonine--tRNA ligase [Patescibacteria group bacterium]|nr:threonine--tRNA ligase [Patescibacteria group bacterium]
MKANPDFLPHLRHTLAHLLASAVLELYPDALPTIGPAIDNGFYYDFQFSTPISDKDLPKIEKKMEKILSTWLAFSHREVSESEAKKIFKGNPYKLELIDEIVSKNEKITLYKCGDFEDLCRGGHLEHPAAEIKPGSFKLTRTAGAYWRGDEKNAMLTRIYGLAFETKEKLDEYEEMLVEAEKRDHRKLGKELGLFTFDEDVGPGLPLWLPNGTVIVEELEKLAKETEFRHGYSRVRTPNIAKESMYIKSGHLPYYEESMFPPMEYEGGKYYLKAMNCPHHHKIFDSSLRSYKELPLRLAEYGTCYRHEKSGELFGLMRVRMLEMNDAHIYCTEEQFADEFRAVNEMYLHYFKTFGIGKYIMRFSTHDPKKLGQKYVNDPVLWKKTEDMVRQVLIDSKIPYVEVANEAAFYGPKIDVQVWSAIGREFTLATNQVDFAVPARFGLTYIDSDGTKKTPLCIHRAPLGTHERFIGFLIEHYGGNFPLWLAPTQVSIVPVGEAHHDIASDLYQKLHALGIRTTIDLSKEGFGKKIRNAKMSRAPYFIIIGDKDAAVHKATLESRDAGQIGQLTAEEIIEKLKVEISTRK